MDTEKRTLHIGGLMNLLVNYGNSNAIRSVAIMNRAYPTLMGSAEQITAPEASYNLLASGDYEALLERLGEEPMRSPVRMYSVAFLDEESFGAAMARVRPDGRYPQAGVTQGYDISAEGDRRFCLKLLGLPEEGWDSPEAALADEASVAALREYLAARWELLFELAVIGRTYRFSAGRGGGREHQGAIIERLLNEYYGLQ